MNPCKIFLQRKHLKDADCSMRQAHHQRVAVVEMEVLVVAAVEDAVSVEVAIKLPEQRIQLLLK